MSPSPAACWLSLMACVSPVPSAQEHTKNHRCIKITSTIGKKCTLTGRLSGGKECLVLETKIIFYPSRFKIQCEEAGLSASQAVLVPNRRRRLNVGNVSEFAFHLHTEVHGYIIVHNNTDKQGESMYKVYFLKGNS